MSVPPSNSSALDWLETDLEGDRRTGQCRGVSFHPPAHRCTERVSLRGAIPPSDVHHVIVPDFVVECTGVRDLARHSTSRNVGVGEG
jgi:hypothetical protein